MHVEEATRHPLDGVWGRQTPKRHAANVAAPVNSASQSAELLTEAESAALLCVGVRKFHQLRKTAEWLPQPIALGPRCLRWSRAELLAALAERAPRVTVQAEPAHLQQSRGAT